VEITHGHISDGGLTAVASSNEGAIPAPNPPARDGAAVQADARVEGLVEFTRTARVRSLTEVLEAVARAASGVAGFANVAVNVYRPAWDDYETVIVLASEEAQWALLGTTNPVTLFAQLSFGPRRGFPGTTC
jgi:hypothetical protein